ncbi:alpha/beta fold hydrolase [Ruegeria sp.]|uniref:alpha/beta fold hydrolase n=1 Tax=Ruegeria sp. TaxID=1879320 RepID=UPI00231A584B|nr:alpha/beta fold hydrolase [Ruegeria sp.]MDA7965369.1 alpha/beta fold hydrolase [Ruegeria sp.]
MGDGHEVFWEEYGHPNGIPVLYLHGGPGRPRPRAIPRLFDPERFRLILMDQRGTRRSRPLGEMRGNTTQALIGDIEALRVLRGIDSWHVFGGSWGSTLGLCYGIAHPDRLRSLTVWGVFLALAAEAEWVNFGARWMKPRECDALTRHVDAKTSQDLLERYRDLITDPDLAIHEPAIRIYTAHQSALADIRHYDPELDRDEESVAEILPQLEIELGYFCQGCFIPDRYILDQIGRLQGVPGTIIQGADDMICPCANATELARAWPDATLHIVPDAGHFVFEPGIAARVMATFDGIARSDSARANPPEQHTNRGASNETL